MCVRDIRRFALHLFLLTAPFCGALTIDGYASSKNDRFANHGDFIANGFNLSGIAISSDGKWATMISPNVFLTAWHFTPGSGQTLTFYATNNPSGSSVTRTVSSTQQQIGTSDLRVVVLDEPLPEGYTYYARETRDIPVPGNTFRHPYWQKEHFHFGRSPGTYTSTLDMGVGKNVVDLYATSQTVSNSSATGPSISAKVDSDSAAVAYETYALDGDSGGPLMIESNGALKLVGIAWFRTTIGDPAVPYSTGFSPVGDYDGEINSFLNTHSLAYQPLPPQNFTALRVSGSQINLSWTDRSAVETSFILERAESADGPWSPLTTSAADSESYTDSSAPAGDVYYRLQSRNDSSSDWVTVSVLTPYSGWAEQFDWAGQDNSPTGDPNTDGIVNLAAYAMDLPPLDPVSAADLPSLETPSGFIDFFYRRNPDADDITFTLKQRSDLLTGDWQSVVIDGTTVTESNMGVVNGAERIRIRMPMSSIGSLGVFRLEIISSDMP